MYNDYPGVSDSYDSNASIEQSQLDNAQAKRTQYLEELGKLSREGDSYTVLGVFYTNIDDARLVRGLRMDRRFRDLDRIDERIAALMLEVGPTDDIEGFDPDAVSEAA